MDYRDAGQSRRPWGNEILDGFPGPVAIAAQPIQGLAPVLGWEEVDDQPWAIQVGYAIPRGRQVLTVRTVRSTEGLSPRHPLESLASVIVNFVNADLGGRAPRRTTVVDPVEATRQDYARMSASRLLRAEVEGTATSPVTVRLDGVAIEGSRVDLERCSAVEVPWDGQIVFCAGLADVLDTLALKSATPDDFVRRTPRSGRE